MPRKWTKEQKEAAAIRMRETQAKRWAKVRQIPISDTEVLEVREQDIAKTRSPEVQAVINSMDPARRAKLAGVQGRIWQDNGRADGKQAQEALARFEAAKRGDPVLQEMAPLVPQTVATNAVDPDAFKAMAMQASPARDPGRIGSREVSLIVKTDGTMVSQYGPCVCGRPKREWHAICCKP
jgi:hypothetical protein